MRKQHRFRAAGIESLEDRSVPSLFGLGGLGHTASVPAQDARLVQQAFNNFQSVYNQDYRNILFGADSSGSINPTTNRAAFDQAINTAIGNLVQTITQTDVANLAATNPNLASQITAELQGTGSSTLQALTTPTGVFNASSRTFQRGARSAIATFENQVVQQVRGATAPTSTTTGGSTGGTTTTLNQALPAVQQAFATFQSAYNTDVQTILYQADASGNINPTNNRAAFNTQVSKDLGTLQTSVNTALTNASASSSLISQADAALTGSGNDSLQTQLTNLATPTGAYTLSANLFQAESRIAIGAAQQTVTSAIVGASGGSGYGYGYGHGGFLGGLLGGLFGF